MSFASDIARFVAKTKKKLDYTFRQSAYVLGERIVVRWPVGNPALWESGQAPAGYVPGHSKANWQGGVNTVPSGVKSGADASGSATLAALKSSIGRATIGDTIFIVNNVVYAPRIEYGGHSKQAPAGVLGIVVRDFRNIVHQVAREAQ